MNKRVTALEAAEMDEREFNVYVFERLEEMDRDLAQYKSNQQEIRRNEFMVLDRRLEEIERRLNLGLVGKEVW